MRLLAITLPALYCASLFGAGPEILRPYQPTPSDLAKWSQSEVLDGCDRQLKQASNSAIEPSVDAESGARLLSVLPLAGSGAQSAESAVLFISASPGPYFCLVRLTGPAKYQAISVLPEPTIGSCGPWGLTAKDVYRIPMTGARQRFLFRHDSVGCNGDYYHCIGHSEVDVATGRWTVPDFSIESAICGTSDSDFSAAMTRDGFLTATTVVPPGLHWKDQRKCDENEDRQKSDPAYAAACNPTESRIWTEVWLPSKGFTEIEFHSISNPHVVPENPHIDNAILERRMAPSIIRVYLGSSGLPEIGVDKIDPTTIRLFGIAPTQTRILAAQPDDAMLVPDASSNKDTIRLCKCPAQFKLNQQMADDAPLACNFERTGGACLTGLVLMVEFPAISIMNQLEFSRSSEDQQANFQALEITGRLRNGLQFVSRAYLESIPGTWDERYRKPSNAE